MPNLNSEFAIYCIIILARSTSGKPFNDERVSLYIHTFAIQAPQEVFQFVQFLV